MYKYIVFLIVFVACSTYLKGQSINGKVMESDSISIPVPLCHCFKQMIPPTLPEL